MTPKNDDIVDDTKDQNSENLALLDNSHDGEQSHKPPETKADGTPLPTSPIETDSLFESLLKSIKTKLVGEESHLSWFTSTMIMISLSYGSAVVILPYTMAQLGPITWFIYTSMVLSILAFCTVLLKDCCVKVMEERNDYSMMRHPYPTIAEMVVGPRFGKLVRVFLYICLVSMALAFTLLGATILNDITTLEYSYYERIRIWLVVAFVLMYPLMLVGTYSNLQMPAVIAVLSSTISMFCIVALCVVAWWRFGYKAESFLKKDLPTQESFFIIFGDVTFAACGPAIALPNIIVFIKTPSKFHYSIIVSHLTIFFIYVLCAVVPYAVFGIYVTPSITETLSTFQTETNGECSYCTVLLVVCQLSMTTHFILVSVLSMNPVFLSLENQFNIPINFTWKRLVIRSSVVLSMLAFCLIVPYFSPVLSLVGAVPQTLLTVIFPIIIYWHKFTMPKFMKPILLLLVGLAIFLIVGNTVASILSIVSAISTNLN